MKLKKNNLYGMIMWEGWERRDQQRRCSDGIHLAGRRETDPWRHEGKNNSRESVGG